jgi:hypothetical protein
VTRDEERRQVADVIWRLRVQVWLIALQTDDPAIRERAWRAELQANATLAAIEMLLELPR